MKLATRAAILEAAEAVFAEHGFHGAKMEEIASRAGVAVGTLYNYFEDRKHLLGALLDCCGAELDVRLAATLEGRRPFPDRLEAFLGAAVQHLDEHWRVFAILVEDELAFGRGGSGDSRHRPMLREVYRAGEKLCALGVRQRALRNDDAELFPSLLVGSIHALFRHQLFVGRGEPLASKVPALARYFLQGAGAPP
ncbi:MAG TPA: TetR/AcrR family transcriptional regulator [Myxococcales bacterium]|jgi:AcrR family transcriptional regulator